jgi:hypothetical protein
LQIGFGDRGAPVQTVKYRLFEPRLAPRRTKIEVPGCGGKSGPRRDGSHE